MKSIFLFLAILTSSTQSIHFRPPRAEDDEDLKPPLTESEKADLAVDAQIQKRKDFYVQKHKDEALKEEEKERKLKEEDDRIADAHLNSQIKASRER